MTRTLIATAAAPAGMFILLPINAFVGFFPELGVGWIPASIALLMSPVAVAVSCMITIAAALPLHFLLQRNDKNHWPWYAGIGLLLGSGSLLIGNVGKSLGVSEWLYCFTLGTLFGLPPALLFWVIAVRSTSGSATADEFGRGNAGSRWFRRNTE